MYTSLSSMFSHLVLKIFYMCHMKTIINFFFSLIWLSILVYYFTGQLFDPNKQHLKKLTNDIFIDGTPSKLMAELGFYENSKFFPQAYHDENLPIFVLPLDDKDLPALHGFLFSFRRYYKDKKLLIYNIGLSTDDLHMVERHCRCLVRQVHWERYPSHIQDRKLKAYVPILLQEALQEFGAVFFCDVTMRFNSSQLDPEITTQAFMYGLASWRSELYPTSSLTHYNMFRYFNASHNEFYFHRMSGPTPTLYYNTENIHKHLMLPWVKCVLEYDCIKPLGAQPGGCNFLHKPKYVYAGCHKYDTAAFNVLLGLMFNFETPYMSQTNIFYIEEIKQQKHWTFENFTSF